MHTYAKRRLDPQHSYKPLDFGNGLLAGSVTPNGRITMLGAFHSRHGWAMLSAAPPFPASYRSDQTAVRAYRASLAQPDAPSFGLRLLAPISALETQLLADAIPFSQFRTNALDVRVTTWAPRTNNSAAPVAVQSWAFRNPGPAPVTLPYVWDGPRSLSRASYTQLTERGPLPPIDPQLRTKFTHQRLAIVAPQAEMVALIAGLPAGPAWQQTNETSIDLALRGSLLIAPAATVRLDLIYVLAETETQAHTTLDTLGRTNVSATLVATLTAHETRRHALVARLDRSVQKLAHRAQAYALDCCAVPVGDGLCLLTDHQILPLSWTRDAYYVLQGLCLTDAPHTRALRHKHLIWLFDTAQRPSGYWGRAYLAHGQPKDDVFQLDQQCYPLLELAEYAALNDDPQLVEQLCSYVPAILEIMLARRAPDLPFCATEETPADDPMPLPYHFSSHVLLWHTLRRLAPVNTRWKVVAYDLAAWAQSIQQAIWKHFVVAHGEQRLFAYAVDEHGNYRLYHDANDLPTVLAPCWGFCPPTDPTWRATLDWAFSSGNIEGYFTGATGGLGSVHTPGAWPLGDVQELAYARLSGDQQRVQTVLARLAATACWDGALPEARDPQTGAVRSRHWFAWPSAALLAALLHPDWQARA